MTNTEAAIDKAIENLNSNRNISHITLDNLEDWNLTDTEKDFIKTYLPERSLIVYGTLAPGKPNHAVVEHINGKWQKAVIRGKLEKEGWAAGMGYYGFRHTNINEQDEIEAMVLFSDELVANWQQIDEFEGDEYKRIVAKFELDNGAIGAGYIYAINEE